MTTCTNMAMSPRHILVVPYTSYLQHCLELNLKRLNCNNLFTVCNLDKSLRFDDVGLVHQISSTNTVLNSEETFSTYIFWMVHNSRMEVCLGVGQALLWYLPPPSLQGCQDTPALSSSHSSLSPVLCLLHLVLVLNGQIKSWACIAI